MVRCLTWYAVMCAQWMPGFCLVLQALAMMHQLCQGDMRKMVTLMQGAAQKHGADITPAAILDIVGIVPAHTLARWWTSVKLAAYGDIVREEVRVALSA